MKRDPLLDLHGYRTDDVPDAVDRFLRDSIRRRALTARIMTGKGTGAVKKAVVNYLRLGGFPHKPERLPNGGTNDGVLVVFLDED